MKLKTKDNVEFELYKTLIIDTFYCHKDDNYTHLVMIQRSINGIEYMIGTFKSNSSLIKNDIKECLRNINDLHNKKTKESHTQF